MITAYTWCISGGLAGAVAIIFGLGLGIKARLKLNQPVARTLARIAGNFLLVGSIVGLSLLAISLCLRQPRLY